MSPAAAHSRIVILSPHPDDAVWSLGGAIPAWREKHDVVILTLFDGDPEPRVAAQMRDPQHRWRSFGEMATRRIEDRAAAAVLGAELTGLDQVEAAFRIDAAGTFSFTSPDSLFLLPSHIGQEFPVFDAIVAMLRANLGPDDQVIAPLGFGGHFDHRATHQIALRLPQTSAFYAEFPYFQADRKADLAAHIEEMQWPLTATDSPGDWTAWTEAALCHRSQLVRMFGSRAGFLDALRDYALAWAPVPSCRIWQIRRR